MTHSGACAFISPHAIPFSLACMIKVAGLLTMLCVGAHALSEEDRKSILQFHTAVREHVRPRASNMMLMVSRAWAKYGVAALSLPLQIHLTPTLTCPGLEIFEQIGELGRKMGEAMQIPTPGSQTPFRIQRCWAEYCRFCRCAANS